MPRINVFQGGNIAPEGTTGARVRPADFSANPIATGLQQLGQAAAEYVDTRQQADDLQDRASVKEAVNALSQHYAEVGYTGSDAYYQKGGKDALTTRMQVESGLDTFIKQSRQGLGNDRQRKLYDEAVTPQRQAWGIQIANHANKEAKRYDADETVSRITLSGELARSTYVADPDHGEDQIATGLNEIDNLARLESWGPDRLAAEKLKFTSSAYKDVAASLVYQGDADGPKLAQAFLDRHQDSMSGDDRQTVSNHIRVQNNALEAEQRRLAAEAARQAREQRQDAKDRAQSVYRNVQDGVVVEPKVLASAMDDARFADDPALVEGLRQGGLKNGLTAQWNGVPPPQLQARINELSAEIAQAGGNVEPDKMIERDHLETLLARSNSELNTDALSWGAKHLGINVGRLDLANADSVRARINAATTIAKRTGKAPQPLTNEEVAATQTILTQGSVKDKTGLALRLARLGPLALPAAQQLTNNSGFHNLIGLAGHRNAGVAASRVTQVVEGYEVLKTKPKLIDKGEALAHFNEFTGNALAFLPTVKTGVFSNAQAILASESNERGYSEWVDARSRWYAAVNSALGAYSKGGKQYGGLHGHNGGITVLPEDMNGEEFEAKIARSRGPQIKAAQNGTPLYSDGRIATATEVKAMQWVPARDGVYRLSDGRNFLHTNAGGFYEIDIRKLR